MNDNSMLYLVLLGFASGFINMFAGGGSMLVVPFLIFLGLPPHVANATNRVAIFLQNIVSTATFRQKKILNFKTDYPYCSPLPWEVFWELLRLSTSRLPFYKK